MARLKCTITPRLGDTDLFGHINNTVIPVWFESARKPIFEMFVPDLSVNRIPLILLHLEVDFLAETFWHTDVEILSGIEKTGNSSATLIQELWQNGHCSARGKSVFAHYSPELKKSVPLTEEQKTALNTILWEAS